MAEIQGTFVWKDNHIPDESPTIISRTIITQTYDYDKIFDGTFRRYTKGKDFYCLATSFASSVHKTARQRGIKVKTYVEDENNVIAGSIL